MASLAIGTVNFSTIIYENAPATVRQLSQEMRRHAVVSEIEIFDLAPVTTWTAVSIGRHQREVIEWVLSDGDAVRTGLEDNIRTSRERLASSNAELVHVAAPRCAARGRRVATPHEARRMPGLRGARA